MSFEETSSSVSSDSGISSPGESSVIQAEGSSYHKAQYLPPCRVCGNSASGFHYGVNSCEACKAFFRRSVARNAPYTKCQSGGNCAVKFLERNSCAHCRFKKCLIVGMSKTAIKTGRYTHEKRTQDTKEVKGLHNDLFTPKFNEDCEYNRIITNIVQAYEESFPDSAYGYRNSKELEIRFQNLMLEHNMTEVDRILYSPGHTEPDPFDETLRRNLGIFEYLDSMGSSLMGSDSALLTDPMYVNYSKEMIETWLLRIDKFIRNMIQFAKSVPGFKSLSMSDQIVLIKAVKVDIFGIQRHRAFNMEKQCILDYRSETGDFWVLPFSFHEQIFCYNEDHMLLFKSFNAIPIMNYFMLASAQVKRHFLQLLKVSAVLSVLTAVMSYMGFNVSYVSSYLFLYSSAVALLCAIFVRFLCRIQSHSYTIEGVAVLAAFCMLCPDVEGLSEPEKVEEVRGSLLKVLEYTLQKTHSGDPSILAKTLLLLPMLRSSAEYHAKGVQIMQDRYHPNVPPLLKELLPHAKDSHKLDGYRSS